MKWKSVRLSDIADFSNGVNFDKSSYAKGVKLIGVSNFGNRFYPDYDKLDEIKADVVRENDYLNDGDIVFVRSNGNKELVGRCMLVTNAPTKVTYSGFCIRCRVKDTLRVYPKFLTYYFKSSLFRCSVSGSAIGANIQNLSQGRMASHVLLLPDLPTQHRIASILSAYDDLIENNRRQIKLLEEAAQRLYREWFVELRFPGYENVKIVDGMPEGWKEGFIGDIAQFQRGKTIRKTDITAGSIPVVAGGLEPAYYHNKANTVGPVITVSGSGANAGYTKLYNENIFASDCSFVDSTSTPHLFFLFCCLRDRKAEIDSLQKGAAQPHVYAKDINALRAIIPTQSILCLFMKIATPLFIKRENVEMQIRICIEARDRLLPKLMSGGMEV